MAMITNLPTRLMICHRLRKIPLPGVTKLGQRAWYGYRRLLLERCHCRKGERCLFVAAWCSRISKSVGLQAGRTGGFHLLPAPTTRNFLDARYEPHMPVLDNTGMVLWSAVSACQECVSHYCLCRECLLYDRILLQRTQETQASQASLVPLLLDVLEMA